MKRGKKQKLINPADVTAVTDASILNLDINAESLDTISKSIVHPIKITIELRPDERPKIEVTPLQSTKVAEVSSEPIKKQEQVKGKAVKDSAQKKKKSCSKDEDDHLKRKKVLEITTPDGLIIREKFAYESLIRFVELVGEETIASLDIEALPDIPLVSKTIEDVAASKPTGNGWYVYTGIANNIKAEVITQICKKLDLKYKVKAYSIIEE